MKASIQGRLTLVLVISAGIFLSLGGGWVYSRIRASFYREFDEKLRIQALNLQTGIEQERDYVDVVFSDRYLREYTEEDPVWFFQLWAPLPLDNPDRPKVMRSDSLRENENLPRPAGEVDQATYWDFDLPDGRPARGLALRFVPHTERRDRKRNFREDLVVDMVVAQDRTPLNRALQAVSNQMLVGGGAGLLVILVLVPVILARLFRPLSQMSEKAKSIDSHSLEERFESDVVREVQPIANALNDLMDRIRESFVRERQFSADIAHELRTPLAELKSGAEVKLKWPDQTDGCFEEDVLAISRRMESVVEALSKLSRVEQGGKPECGDTVDLVKEASDCLKLLDRRIQERGIRLTREMSQRSPLQTNADLLRTIFMNLLSNAVDHAPERSEVHVSVGSSRTLLEIRNAAPNLTPEDLPKLFHRFWRHDLSRTNEEHSGLGLSLAATCAAAMGLSVKAELSQGRILTMRLVRVEE